MRLFFTFFKIGLFTIGGGYAVLPLIEKAVVEPGQMSKTEFYELIAVTESLPGVFATNIAALVGFRLGGVIGGLVASVATIIGPLVTILLIAVFFHQFQDNLYVTKAFRAVRPAVVALIVAPMFGIAQANGWNAKNIITALVALGLMVFAGVSPVWIVIGGCVMGFVQSLYELKT